MSFEYLADHKQAIPAIAKSYFTQWGPVTGDASAEETSQRLQRYLYPDNIPLMLLVVEREQILGVAQLKYHEIYIPAQKALDRRHFCSSTTSRKESGDPFDRAHRKRGLLPGRQNTIPANGTIGRRGYTNA